MQRVIIAVVLSFIVAQPLAPADVPPKPHIVTVGATAADQERLDLAISRFAAAGLELPALSVEFHDDLPACLGHHGLFRASTDPWTVLICSDAEWVYEHELAHAWAAKNLVEADRQAFVEETGLEAWSGSHIPWRERGTEIAAVTIQQGLSGGPLPARLSPQHRARVAAFEFLTGVRSPQLTEWQQNHGDTALQPPA